MPTFTSTQVKVAALTLRTSLELDEIRGALAVDSPNHSGRDGGWRSADDTGSNINVRNGVPPQGEPSILDEVGDFPERVSARYYFWRFDLDENLDESDDRQYRLDAVDVLISEAAGDFLLLVSSQETKLSNIEHGRVTKALLETLQGQDPEAEILPGSVLNMSRNDIYLWLTRKASVTPRPDIGAGVTVRDVAGIGAEENRRRAQSGLLRGEVDMQRVSFLSAIAEGSVLGPAYVTFAETDDKGRIWRFSARLFLNGDFGLMLSKSAFRDLLEPEAQRLESVQRFAYRYIPMVIAAYRADTDWGTKDRDWLIIEKQLELAERYSALARIHARWAEYEAEQPAR